MAKPRKPSQSDFQRISLDELMSLNKEVVVQKSWLERLVEAVFVSEQTQSIERRSRLVAEH